MIFALSFLWVYYCLKSAFWALTLSAVIALCSAYILWRIQTKAGVARQAKQKNKKAVASFYDYLKFNADNAQLFQSLYEYYRYDVEKIDYDSFVATKDGQKTYVALRFENDSFSVSDLRAAIVTAKRANVNKLCIYAGKIDPPIKRSAAQHFDVTFVDANNAYALLEQCDKLPNVPQIKPIKASFAASYAFCRKRFGWYFASSVFLTIISIVAYFPYYTLGWATVMLCLALYSMFNTRYNVKTTGVKLD